MESCTRARPIPSRLPNSHDVLQSFCAGDIHAVVGAPDSIAGTDHMLLIGRGIGGANNSVQISPSAGSLTITSYAPTITHVIDTLSLNRFNGSDGGTSLTDEIDGVTWSIRNNAELDTAEQKFGTSSILIPVGVDEEIRSQGWVSPHEGSWTIEGWVYWDVEYGDGHNWEVAIQNDDIGDCQNFTFAGNGTIVSGHQGPGGNWGTGATTSGSGPMVWFHWAMQRNVDTDLYEIYFNGVKVFSASWASSTYEMDTFMLKNNTDVATVWFDEVRFSKVIRYSGDTISVPSGEFTVD